jgi:hypothetical protein
LNNKLFISINNNYNLKSKKTMGCGCKGGKKNVAETTTTTTTTTTTQPATTATVPTVQPTSN